MHCISIFLSCVKPRFNDQIVCVHALRRINECAYNTLTESRKWVGENLGMIDEGLTVLPDDDSDDDVEPQPVIRTVLQDAFVRAMNEFVVSYAEQMPHMLKNLSSDPADVQNKKFVPLGLFKDRRDVFKYFRGAGLFPREVKDRYLWVLWDRFFPEVEIKQSIPFSQCEECHQTAQQLITSKTEEAKAAVKLVRDQHRIKNKLARNRMHCRFILGEMYSTEVLSIAIDGMDNNKTYHPKQARPSKDVEGAGQPLATKLTGVLVRGGGFYGAWTFPRHQTGSSYVATVLLGCLQYLENRNGPDYRLPPVLLIQVRISLHFF